MYGQIRPPGGSVPAVRCPLQKQPQTLFPSLHLLHGEHSSLTYCSLKSGLSFLSLSGVGNLFQMLGRPRGEDPGFAPVAGKGPVQKFSAFWFMGGPTQTYCAMPFLAALSDATGQLSLRVSMYMYRLFAVCARMFPSAL